MQTLFPKLSPEICKTLAELPRALDAVAPLNSAHRRDLAAAVAELSLQLTAERSALSRPYWVSPRLTSAYLRYFLPWNLVRQTRLLAALPLTPPTPLAREDGRTQPRLLADMGCGPLTFTLALWLARPQWRNLPLTVLCMDLSPHVMELGRALFSELAGPDSPWHIVLRRGGVDTVSRHVRELPAAPWLISAANVLNELKSQPDQERGDKLEEVLEQTASLLTLPDAQALFIEPGTRLGGKTIMNLRTLAQEYGLAAAAPCPHTGPCPLAESRTWCHFTFDTQGAPAWLNKLSEAADLQKEALSLSMLLLRQEESLCPPRRVQGRVVSAPLQVPGLRGLGRYACMEQGLALLEDAACLPSGALVNVDRPETCRKDGKSGADIMPAATHEGGKQAAALRAARPQPAQPQSFTRGAAPAADQENAPARPPRGGSAPDARPSAGQPPRRPAPQDPRRSPRQGQDPAQKQQRQGRPQGPQEPQHKEGQPQEDRTPRKKQASPDADRPAASRKVRERKKKSYFGK